MDLLLTGEDQSQADQPKDLAEGHPMYILNQDQHVQLMKRVHIAWGWPTCVKFYHKTFMGP
jgi:hypothetical protein